MVLYPLSVNFVAASPKGRGSKRLSLRESSARAVRGINANKTAIKTFYIGRVGALPLVCLNNEVCVKTPLRKL